MVTWFYFIVFVLALIMAGSFMVRNKNVDTVFCLFSMLVMINCFGRYLLSTADSLEMAVWANKYLYVGGCYAPLMTVIVLARLCNKKMPRLLLAIMTGYATLVTGLVMTIGKCGIYYKHVELGHGNGYNYLIKTYGPLHILYPIMMVIYAAIMLYYLVYALRRRKEISFRAVVTLGFTGFTVIFLYILERVLGSNVSFLAVGYLIGIALMTMYFERINMYDMSANIVSSIERMKEYGYMVFDDKYRYVNANDFAKHLFPEIKSWVVDKEVPVSDNYLYREVVQYLLTWDGTEKVNKVLSVGDGYYQMDIRKISYGKKSGVGFLVELVDRTLEQKYYKTIEEYNVSLEKEVAEKTKNILHIKDMMVLGMAEMVESRDSNTGGHIKRTSAVVQVFSRRLQNYRESFDFDEKFLLQVEKAAPMHDLGKIAVDDAVLRKPGKYTEEEYAEMKKHPVEGAKIVENILRGVEDDDFVEIARNVALYHHEKWNGQGYPTGLSETEIPTEARIMALADVFDALVSKRCYKEAFSYEQAFAIIEESLGQHFDPELGKIFMECRPELEALYQSYI
ncbi:MAG: HD-GYP domain-containing protein [Roseburia sp.]